MAFELSIADKAIERFKERIARLYEQGLTIRSKVVAMGTFVDTRVAQNQHTCCH